MSLEIKRVLAIETSCDDTSVAVVDDTRTVRALCAASQDAVHAPFGGVVPEIASRNHTLHLLPLVEKALKQAGCEWSEVDGIAVTNRPGLVGSLLVGLVTAKTLALSRGLPFIGVNHLEGHIFAPFLRDEKYESPEPEYPFLALAVSGGHTSLYRVDAFGEYRVLGQTMDDAAGEAFDKFAKMMGLGYPGGVQVDRLSASGRADAFDFPRALIREENYDFSFSGLKASAGRLLEKIGMEEAQARKADLCASYQQAIVDALMAKLERAAEDQNIPRAVVTGGVSANSGLRRQAQEWADRRGIRLIIPPIRFCTDNAAMIGLAGLIRLKNGERSPQTLSPSPRPLADDFRPSN